MNNPYTRYYLQQQQGRGIPVFRGSPWQMGHGQMGYGLGGLFRSMARAVMPMVKSGAKTLGNIALNSGKDLLGDVKEAAKAHALEAANVAKNKAVQRVRTLAQTGSGRRAKQPRTGSKGTKRKRETAKKRKRSPSAVRTTLSKKRKTSPQDIFG